MKPLPDPAGELAGENRVCLMEVIPHPGDFRSRGGMYVVALLLPVMVSFFGWIHVLFFMFLIVAGSLGVGSIVAVVVRLSYIDIGLDPVRK